MIETRDKMCKVKSLLFEKIIRLRDSKKSEGEKRKKINDSIKN